MTNSDSRSWVIDDRFDAEEIVHKIAETPEFEDAA
jgi:hypothetical protein